MYRFKVFFKGLKFIDKLTYLYGKTIELILPERYNKIVHLRTFINNVHSLGYDIKHHSNHLILQSTSKAIELRNNTSDRDVFSQVFINNEYQVIIDYVIINQLKLNTIIDAGANIGLTALKFATFFPDSKIICLEPDPNNYRQLQINLNGMINIACLQNALWYKSDILALSRDFRDSREWSIHVTKPHNGDKDLVSALSIHDIIKNYNLQEIDFLKIDVEGSEAEIFKEEHNLSYLNMIKIIAIEIHDEFNCRLEIYEILKDYGFSIINSGEFTIGIKPSL
ncbi:FkbM family methyltransferase [Pedobacter agri]|uniref:FkbM family methyltransferase n=1 Tax=Pedobacter agri TaxID=454586 RepID=UPI00292D9084|nr:FkbM family methyltransferase [Pedobacter agri]